jgi:hypothetical protein
MKSGKRLRQVMEEDRMERRVRRVALVTVALAGIAISAGAQESGGVVRGNSNINVHTGNVNTIAAGSNNVAKTSIGSIKGGATGGNVTVDVKNVSNVVTGHGKKGCVNIGTKGADPDCK